MKKMLVLYDNAQNITCAFRDKGIECYSQYPMASLVSKPLWHLYTSVEAALQKEWDCVISLAPALSLTYQNKAGCANRGVDRIFQRTVDKFKDAIPRKAPRYAVISPASVMRALWRVPDQIVHGYEFGYDSAAMWYIWLHNLPELKGTQFVKPNRLNKKGQPVWGTPKSVTRRQRYLDGNVPHGMALAMADQWSDLI